MFTCQNPATGELISTVPFIEDAELEQHLQQAAQAAEQWQQYTLSARAELLLAVADKLSQSRERLASLMALEMGKLHREGLAEVDKCAAACVYFAENAHSMLRNDAVETPAQRSYVRYQPLGVVFAIMPWNFPLWQVFRCVVPALMAGNAALIKHAPNVPGCAAAIEALFAEAGAPLGLVTNLYISTQQAAAVIADSRVQGVAFTGSEAAGRAIGALAGQHLKKVVLELGGSDPFIILDDADLTQAVDVAVRARFSNAGQICIAAKRFLVVQSRVDEFTQMLLERVQGLQTGDPMDNATTLAPMARADLRDLVHQQAQKTLSEGARLLTGCQVIEGAGYFYAPSVIDQVKVGMTAFSEEVFGPVAAITTVRDEADAIAHANATRFGLGASVWTADIEKGEALIQCLNVGAGFVNAQVASDVRMPFGGTKASGVGRELGCQGIREFCNVQSVWVA